MLYNFCFWFIMLLLYSVIGYIVEIINLTIMTRKPVWNRGFLIGPYLPIYGVGSLFMIFFLNRYENDLVALFIMGTFFCTLLEYFTSLCMEKIFKLRWWDYTNYKFNLNGRVCLLNAFLFGIGGIIIVKVLNPILSWLVYLIPREVTICLGIILFIIFVLDFIISCYITNNLKINFSKYLHVDATSKIKKEVTQALKKNILLTSRLLKAFPGVSSANKRFKDFLKLFQTTEHEFFLLKSRKQQKKNKECSSDSVFDTNK